MSNEEVKDELREIAGDVGAIAQVVDEMDTDTVVYDLTLAIERLTEIKESLEAEEV